MKCAWCLSINKIQCMRNFCQSHKKEVRKKKLKPIKIFITYIHHLYIAISITLPILQVESMKNNISLRMKESASEWDGGKREYEQTLRWNPVDRFNVVQYSFNYSVSFFPTLSHISNRFFASADRTWCLFLFCVFNLSDEKVNDWPI